MRWSSGSVRRADLALITAAALTAGPLWADTAYVTCQNGHALSIMDLPSGAEQARWSVPGQPAGVHVTANAVYTVAPEAKTLRRHARDGTVTAQAALDGGPLGIVVDDARGRVFVSDWYNARIWVLDTALSPVGELTTGAAPAGLALSDDGHWLASADRDADKVTLFDAETLSPHLSVPTGTRPFGLRFAPDGRLFVGNVGSNDVTVIDPTSGEVLATLPVGDRPYGIAFAQGRAFVTNQYEDSVSVIDLATLSDLGKIDVGEYPEGIDTTTDGRGIVVANWFDNSVSLIDAESLTVTASFDTCDGPRAFGRFVRKD